MSFQRNYISLIINGVQYDKDALLAGDWKQNVISTADNSWHDSLQDFLSEWANDQASVNVYTSGSTGTPKIIQLSKERMLNSAFMTGKYFDFKSGNRALLCLPCNYIAGKMMLVRAMVWGLDLQIVPPTGNPMETINQSVDFAAMVSLQVSNIFDHSPEKLSLIKKLIIGGGKVNGQLRSKLQTISTQCFATYGMTETITHVAIKILNGVHQSDYFNGLSNICFAQDKRNCLTIDAPRLSENLIITNDLVALKNEKQFVWLGRFDNVINTGGIKVFPEKIEAKLEQLIPQRFFISALTDRKLENKVVLIIEGKEWMPQKIDALILDLKHVLSKFERPKNIFFIDHFVETPTKKIQRNRTKEKLVKFNL